MGAIDVVRISVILPTHRVDESFFQALESAKNQLLKPSEIIVVFDGVEPPNGVSLSANNAVKVYAVHLEKNRGPSFARNKGVSVSTGDYLAFLDSDDQWLPDKLLNQATELKKDKSRAPTICVSSVAVIKYGEVAQKRRPNLMVGSTTSSLLQQWPYLYLGSTLFVSREVFYRVGPFNERMRIYEDFEWQIRFSKLNDMQVLCSFSHDVLIAHSLSIRRLEDLDYCIAALKQTMNGIGADSNRNLRSIAALYNLDLAKALYFRRKFFQFCIKIFLSFWHVPRLKIHTDRYWL